MKITSNGKSQNEKYKLLLWCDRKLKSESKRKKIIVFDSQQQKAVRECTHFNSWFTFMHHRKSQHPIFKQTKKTVSVKKGLLVVFLLPHFWITVFEKRPRFTVFYFSQLIKPESVGHQTTTRIEANNLSVASSMFHLICCLNASMDRKSVEDHQHIKTCYY